MVKAKDRGQPKDWTIEQTQTGNCDAWCLKTKQWMELKCGKGKNRTLCKYPQQAVNAFTKRTKNWWDKKILKTKQPTLRQLKKENYRLRKALEFILERHLKPHKHRIGKTTCKTCQEALKPEEILTILEQGVYS